jgi:hypothetical protein
VRPVTALYLWVLTFFGILLAAYPPGCEPAPKETCGPVYTFSPSTPRFCEQHLVCCSQEVDPECRLTTGQLQDVTSLQEILAVCDDCGFSLEDPLGYDDAIRSRVCPPGEL